MLTPPRLIILGAGTPFQGIRHSALRAVDRHSRVLDWILHAFEPLGAETVFLGGYQLDEVMARFPSISYVSNEGWRSTGAAGSLRLAPLREGVDHFLCYSDIIVRPGLVQRLAQVGNDALSVAVDRSYPDRYRELPPAQIGRREKARLGVAGRLLAAGYDLPDGEDVGEFIGLVRIPGSMVGEFAATLAGLPAELHRAHLAELCDQMVKAGMAGRAVEACGDWSDLNSPRCVARFVLGSKGETLERLQSMVRRAQILPQVRFDVGEWRRAGAEVVGRITRHFAGRRLAVRSSAMTEDGFEAANAGVYESVLDVTPQQLGDAVDRVIASFGDGRADHQILVQPMAEDVRWSGVVLTRRLATGAPYYTLNYAQGGNTAAVTSGESPDIETVLLLRGTGRLPEGTPPALERVLDAVQEIEDLLDYDALDIEFAASDEGKPSILQVRPLVVGGDRSAEDDRSVEALLDAAARQFEALGPPGAGVSGRRALWGSMPDWNPAEIVGVRPRPLACSLYLHLITNDVWARQRAEYGYRDVRPLPLIRLFAGQPYVDVRASMNSFVPASLPEADASRLVEHCVEFLCRHPELHDKVEFDVIPTCFDLDFGRWESRLAEGAGLSPRARQALAEGLRAITVAGFDRLEDDLAAVECFAGRLPALAASSAPPLERAIALIEDCRQAGTLPFAHLARAAFVAMSLLNSAVRRGILAPARRAEFLESLETVSKEFRRDAQRVKAGELALESLVARYGHLRPGTYEITSERYAASPERYLGPSVDVLRGEPPKNRFDWTAGERTALSAALREAGLPDEVDRFDAFARRAIAGRESSKFVFTRHLSEALELLAVHAEDENLTREDVSHISYHDLRAVALGTLPTGATEFLRRRAHEGRRSARLVESIELPPLISRVTELRAFRYPRSQPNFVTLKQVMAPVAFAAREQDGLAGAIALIPQADPGYDWLFGRGIAGLVTMFGGANSHMAIRAAELGLPAAIGVGEPRFEELSRARVLHLDCRAKRIVVTE